MDIQIRKMEERDIPTIYEYIHKKYVKKYYKEEEEKQWQAHQSWYRFVLHSDAYFFYIIEQETKFVGTVRYELEEEKAIVSIFIREDYRNQGYAKKSSSGEYVRTFFGNRSGRNHCFYFRGK